MRSGVGLDCAMILLMACSDRTALTDKDGVQQPNQLPDPWMPDGQGWVHCIARRRSALFRSGLLARGDGAASAVQLRSAVHTSAGWQRLWPTSRAAGGAVVSASAQLWRFYSSATAPSQRQTSPRRGMSQAAHRASWLPFGVTTECPTELRPLKAAPSSSVTSLQSCRVRTASGVPFSKDFWRIQVRPSVRSASRIPIADRF